MKSLKENYLIAINHGMPEKVPAYSKPVRYNIGLGDTFERGAVGGGYDGFGTLWATEHGSQVPVPGHFVITDITRWKEQVKFPDLDAIDWEAKAEKELAAANRDEQVIEYCMGNGPFERLLDLMGYEPLIVAFMEEEEAVEDYMKAYTEYRLKYLEKVMEHYKPDFVVCFDDCAFDSGPFMTMEQYQQFIGPSHAEFNQAVIDMGAQPIQHCCGHAECFIEEFIKEKAIAWSSVQHYNDIPHLLKTYGKQISLIGGFNTNGPCGMLDVTDDMLIAEIHRCIDTYAPYGSYLLGNHFAEGRTMEEKLRRIKLMNEEAVRYGATFYERLRNGEIEGAA